MALRDARDVSNVSRPASLADKLLKANPDRLWLDCFRCCKTRRNITEHIEEYKFSDGSTLMLDTRPAIPKPVRNALVFEKAF